MRGWISPARMSGLTRGAGSGICCSPSPSRARKPTLKGTPQPAVATNPRAHGLLAHGPYIEPSARAPGWVCGAEQASGMALRVSAGDKSRHSWVCLMGDGTEAGGG